MYGRNLEKGAALVNPIRQPRTIAIEKGYRRLKGSLAPGIDSGAPESGITLSGKDGIILLME